MSNFSPASDIEGTVKDLIALKGGCRQAIGGARVLGPHIANQVQALYELAGADENSADAMADGIRARAQGIEEHLEAVRQELAAIGGMVARAVEAHQENEARRKVTAAKAGARTSSSSSTAKLTV